MAFSHTSTCLAQFREQRFRLSNGQASSVAKVATPNSKRLPNFLMILRRHISLNQCSGRCARSFFSRALRPPPGKTLICCTIAADVARARFARARSVHRDQKLNTPPSVRRRSVRRQIIVADAARALSIYLARNLSHHNFYVLRDFNFQFNQIQRLNAPPPMRRRSFLLYTIFTVQ